MSNVAQEPWWRTIKPGDMVYICNVQPELAWWGLNLGDVIEYIGRNTISGNMRFLAKNGKRIIFAQSEASRFDLRTHVNVAELIATEALRRKISEALSEPDTTPPV